MTNMHSAHLLSEPIPRSFAARAVAFAPFGVIVSVVIGSAAANGGYFESSWGWIALALGWCLCMTVTLTSAGFDRFELGFIGAWLCLAAWVLFTTVFARDAGLAFEEALRDLILPMAAAGALIAVRNVDRSVAALVLGIATALVCAYSLATRLLPDRVGSYDPVAGARLSTPIGYWNGLGLFAALGVLFLLAGVPRGSARTRAVVGASIVVLASTLYFTFSRGAWVALLVGILTGLALEPDRLRSLGIVLALTPPAAAAVWLGSRNQALTHVGVELSRAAKAGHRLAIEIVILAIVGALSGAMTAAIGSRTTLSSGVVRAANRALIGLAVVAVLAATVAGGGPTSLVERARHSFAARPPETHGDLNLRLFNLSGSWRGDLWRSALSNASAHLATGSGAGSFEAYWLEHRKIPKKVRDAHSLYLETLSELGVIGLCCLLVALALPLLAIPSARRLPAVPFVAGAYMAFVIHAALDWDWELPTLMILALSAGAFIVRARRDFRPPPVRRRGQQLLVLGVAVPLMGLAFTGLVGNLLLARSASASRAGDWTVAARDARRASAWLPLSARPLQQLGEAELSLGQAARARASFRRAINNAPDDWELWFDLARASTGRVRTEALSRGMTLNPLSPELAALRSEGGPTGGLSITVREKP
jgi:O-antigen ligase